MTASLIASCALAFGEGHWAYQRPVERPLPAVGQEDWPRGPVDHFLLAAMSTHGLSPAADASPATLCRRLHFDLTGLPPSPQALADFEEDWRRGGESALPIWVDRLLASPQFGEHWARHWFDIVRFAESVTLRGFIFKEAWRYRDYVIDSFNQDLPLDQFIREQIAGDLLDADTLESRRQKIIATTFLQLGNTNLEEQDKKQLEMDVVDEQLDVIGKAFLGQTISCARCHDHKFDPIPTRDYYAMAGILRNVVALKHDNVSSWTEVPLPLDPAQEAAITAAEAEIARLEAELKRLKADLKDPAEPANLAGVVVDSSQARLVGEWQLSQHTKPFVGAGYLHDMNSGKGAKTATFQPNLTQAGRYEVRLAYQPGDNRAEKVPVTVFHADGETTTLVNQRLRPPLSGLLVSLGSFRFEANGFAHVLISNEGTAGHVIANAVQFVPAGSTPEPSNSSGDQSQKLATLQSNLDRLKKAAPKRPKAMAVMERESLVETAVLLRGSVHRLGEVVPRGFLSAAAPAGPPEIADHQSGRRELAAWIASPTNPLTSRVLVNRVWLWLLGDGLVRTPDNFGLTGEPPTHPELLDFLAVRFSASLSEGGMGWSVKRLVRELALSRAYRVASDASAETVELDPENRWRSRASSRRLTAEELRDSLLFISGQLQPGGQGGPGYPADRSSDFDFIPNAPRRSLYLPVFRNAPAEALALFDTAPSSVVTGRRDVSTVPSQALFMLNSPFVRSLAGAAAEKFNRADLLQERIAACYRQTLGRDPTNPELVLAEAHFAQSDGPAAWTDFQHALLCSIDFRYVR